MTIKLNNETFVVESFNKTTNFDGETIFGSGYASVRTSDIDALHELGEGVIETIQIINENNNDEVIYNSTGLNGKITSTEEYLNGDRINININFTFR